MDSVASYFPALGWCNSRKLYRLICAVSGLGSGFKYAIQNAAQLRGNEVVADIGCGDGTFLAILSRRFPHVTSWGLDPDPVLLAHAQTLTAVAKRRVTLRQGFAQHIPQQSETFDVVFCTLTLHHVSDAGKKEVLRELFRILKPGGRVIIADFGKKKYPWLPRTVFFENKFYIESFFAGALPAFAHDAGFLAQIYRPFWGNSISLYIGSKP